MSNTDLVGLYNPANAKNLNTEQLKGLQTLTDDDLRVLAEAYPNTATHNNYLILKDTRLPDDKQVFQTSTFQNLYNLRARHNRKNFIPVSFAAVFEYKGVVNIPATKFKTVQVQDLTGQEITAAKGVKKPIPVAKPQEAGDVPETHPEPLKTPENAKQDLQPEFFEDLTDYAKTFSASGKKNK